MGHVSTDDWGRMGWAEIHIMLECMPSPEGSLFAVILEDACYLHELGSFMGLEFTHEAGLAIHPALDILQLPLPQKRKPKS